MVEKPHRKHLLVDWWTDNPFWLEKGEPMRTFVFQAARVCEFNIIHDHFHNFEPSGYTGFFLLSESHISIHSWVDEGYLALDVFSCRTGKIDMLLQRLRDRISPYRENVLKRERGIISEMQK